MQIAILTSYKYWTFLPRAESISFQLFFLCIYVLCFRGTILFPLCSFHFLYSLSNLIFISQSKGQINYELEYEFNEGKCTVCAVFYFLCLFMYLKKKTHSQFIAKKELNLEMALKSNKTCPYFRFSYIS